MSKHGQMIEMMATDAEKLLASALRLAAEDANVREMNAGYAGAHDDGGASRTRELIEVFSAGRRNTIPKFLEPFVLKATQQADPEYSQYMRLRRKFEDKP